jgi:hypothetical protein
MTPKPMDTRTPGIRPARPGVAVLVAAGCAIVVAFQVALTLGAPLGAAALGGVNAGELPGELRVVTAGSAIVWCAASREGTLQSRHRPGPLRGGGLGCSFASSA